MNPMTTQQLGTTPGRARLGACDAPSAAHCSRAVDGLWAWGWHDAALTSAAVTSTVATMPYVGGNPADDRGFVSIKRHARHLGTRST